MTDLFNLVFVQGDLLATTCNMFVFSLLCEVVYMAASLIGQAKGAANA